MAADGVPTTQLKVDGGMTANNTLMQFQADVLDAKVGVRDTLSEWSCCGMAPQLMWLLAQQVVKSTILETTALGAAYAAGLATGVWKTTYERHTCAVACARPTADTLQPPPPGRSWPSSGKQQAPSHLYVCPLHE